MEVITHATKRNELINTVVRPKAEFALIFSNIGAMRCPIDSKGDVLDGLWLDDKQLISTLKSCINKAESAISISEEHSTNTRLHGRSFIDDTVLLENDDAVVWYTQANTKLTQFYTSHVIPSVPHPQLVFFVSKKHQRLAVVATKQVNRPSLSTPIFHAPLANLYDDTHLCLGTAVLPEVRNSRNIKAMADCLLTSRYSGFKFKSFISDEHTKGLNLWKSLEGVNEFPLDSLLEYKPDLTLEGWIEEQFGAIGAAW
ncbi:hypothetical protein OH460_09010 [Vibrio sp. Makdt]|uniref:hypothetical protein n=1 Tax=Vibrio sp. Makdt TaxID=2998828 RepID=UPI0022CDBA5B|nr:hypothetical protein [Vibrio sp. Makdt]MDA0152441.1 hypothetical protein [Vibrio sp. Makdt]